VSDPWGVLQGLWRFLFPARCFGCGRRGTALCEPCRLRLPFLPAGACRRCGTPRRGYGRCRTCPFIPAELTAIRAVCTYEGAARRAVHLLKFRSGRYLAPVLAELMVDAARRRPLRADLVVPTPLAPARLRRRGYNQAALLARPIAAGLGLAIVEPLTRLDRPPQQTLGARARRENLLGAVRCDDPAAVAGARVVLIDDVATTGSTLAACARALVEAGAGEALALVFARDP
jgi:competence protein ComFC